MSDLIRDSYNDMSELYVAVNRGALDGEGTRLQQWLETFAEVAALSEGPVADLGCGPGFVTQHLTELGLNMQGFDLSPALIAQARGMFPDLDVQVADFTALGLPDASFAGILTRYSLIHSQPSDLANTFVEFARLLRPDAPIHMSFFAASSEEEHGTPFDHKVVTAYALFPATIAGELQRAGFDRLEIDVVGPREGERQLDHAIIHARRTLGGVASSQLDPPGS